MVIADPAPSGQMFDQWVADSFGAICGVYLIPADVTMPAADLEITATYKAWGPTSRSIQLREGGGTGSVHTVLDDTWLELHPGNSVAHGTEAKIRVEQAHCETVVLDRILSVWLAEAVKVFDVDLSRSADKPASAEATAGTDAVPPHQWFWDGHEHVDPTKEAKAQATRLASNTTTLAAEYARQGKDWETELRQRAKGAALMKELGLSGSDTAPDPQQDRDADEEKGKDDSSD